MKTLTQAYAQWKRNVLLPNDERQLKVLEAWEAFLAETEPGKLGTEMIDAFETLWEATLE
jgi:hypothetical protein